MSGPIKLVVPKGNPKMAATLREFADKVESGEIQNIVVVVNLGQENCLERAGAWDSRWHLLGALEYAKSTIHDG
jgi:hypothetical protein